MPILDYMVFVYLIHVGSVLVHELAHLASSILLFKSFEEIRLGNGFYFTLFQKVKISPLILTGYVAVDNDVLLKSSNIKIIIFFLSGLLVNLLVGLPLSLVGQGRLKYIGYLNLLYCLLSLIPIPGTDVFSMVKVLLYKKKYPQSG